jgi:uncharacterized membrane protein
MGIAVALHTLAAAVWVGGMFFAYVCLRPATSLLDPQMRLRLWAGTLSRFFRWIWISAATLLASGLLMIFGPMGGMKYAPIHVHVMFGLGLLMMLLAAHVYFAFYKRLKRLITQSNWPEATKQFAKIRWFMAANLGLGLLVIVIGSSGSYWMQR